MPNAPLRATRGEAEADEAAWLKWAKQWARHGLMYAAEHPANRHADPVGWVDARCTTDDWRIAFCIGLGVSLDNIHPGTGHNLTPRRPQQLELALGSVGTNEPETQK
jgi:hypothetical protein